MCVYVEPSDYLSSNTFDGTFWSVAANLAFFSYFLLFSFCFVASEFQSNGPSACLCALASLLLTVRPKRPRRCLTRCACVNPLSLCVCVFQRQKADDAVKICWFYCCHCCVWKLLQNFFLARPSDKDKRNSWQRAQQLLYTHAHPHSAHLEVT